MVKLTRITTKGGDKGRTSLGNGARVDKHHPRVAAYGTVDEANAVIGLARLYAPQGESEAMLARIQNDLLDLGGDLCVPPKEGEGEGVSLRIIGRQVERLEQEIEQLNAELRPLASFVLPGGTPAAAWLHLARTVVRRAEREVTALAAAEPVNPAVIRYLNRLSDHLFVLARFLNDKGEADILWTPGLNR
jgi:cob(I)alamin adenosyltransferase